MSSLEQVSDAWRAADPESRRSLARETVRRAEASRDSHGAFITLADPESHGSGDDAGELTGVPFAVKDNIDVVGVSGSAGSPLFEGRRVRHDAGVVSVLRDAGAWVVGSASMHELALGVTSNNARVGPVRNPHDPARTAGGSSGGSAAAVALGVVPFALGTDTGASVTLPASFCGVVGFRPTTGRYPGDGIVDISWSRDTVGLHTTSVGDARTVDRLITQAPDGASAADSAAELETGRVRRLGVLVDRFSDLDPEVEKVAHRALDRLVEAGVELVDVSVREEARLAGEGGMTAVLYEVAVLLEEQVERPAGAADAPRLADLADSIASPDVAGIIRQLSEEPITEAQYEHARRLMWRLRREYEAVFRESGVDALIGPTAAALPPALGEDVTFRHRGRDVPTFDTSTRHTGPGTSAGQPMISVPAGSTEDGLPVGMLIEGRRFQDRAVLDIAERCERLFSSAG